MSVPQSQFSPSIELMSVLQQQSLLETRIENNMSGQPIYIGYTNTSNGATDEAIWYIMKLSYDGGNFLARVQKPDNGVGFLYIWDDRVTYFS